MVRGSVDRELRLWHGMSIKSQTLIKRSSQIFNTYLFQSLIVNKIILSTKIRQYLHLIFGNNLCHLIACKYHYHQKQKEFVMDTVEKKGFISMQLQLTEINKNLKTQKFSTGLYTFSTKNLLNKLKHKKS